MWLRSTVCKVLYEKQGGQKSNNYYTTENIKITDVSLLPLLPHYPTGYVFTYGTTMIATAMWEIGQSSREIDHVLRLWKKVW
jgi:hypothetical protein